MGTKTIMIDDGTRLLRFNPENVHYVVAEGNYCNVYGEHKKKLCKLTTRIGKLYEILKDWEFIRVNRSEIVNRWHVTEIVGNDLIMRDGKHIRISQGSYNEVISYFDVISRKG